MRETDHAARRNAFQGLPMKRAESLVARSLESGSDFDDKIPEELKVDGDEVVGYLVKRLRKYLEQYSQGKAAVLGLSGGVDSSVAASIAVKAVGPSRVHLYYLPSDSTSRQDQEDVAAVLKALNVPKRNFQEMPIDPLVRAFTGAIGGAAKDRLVVGNVKARVRMVLLHAFAQSHKALVVGTGDKSELTIGYFCYDEKTRVVTKSGPRGLEELQRDDVVFSYDMNSGKLVESNIGDIFIFDYDGDMINFKSVNTDLLVTPNHRMLVHPSWPGRSKHLKPAFRTAEECLRRRNTILPVPAGWDGKKGLLTKFPVTFSQRHIERTISIEIEDLFFVFGLFIGDGSAIRGTAKVPAKSNLTRAEYQALARDRRGKFVQLSPGVSKPSMKVYDTYETDFALPSYTKNEARTQLVAVLEKYGIGYSLTKDLVRIPSKGLFDLFSQCGFGAIQKRIPPWVLDYPSEYLVFLARGLRASDGNQAGPEVYYTSSLRLRDDFVELCVKLGRIPKVSTKPPKVSRLKSGKVIRSSTSYAITYARAVMRTRKLDNSKARRIPYKGKVWCPSVPPFENMLVERNGNYAFCGNTKFGDGGVDVLPLGDLFKTQVRQLAAHLGLPKTVYLKPPTPGLWEGQSAEGELGIDYFLLDRILYHRFDLWESEEQVAKELGVPRERVERIVGLVKKTQHKRYPPEIFRVSFRSHGSDWRYPREWR